MKNLKSQKLEILVYSKDSVTSKMRLVAVEYSVPINLSPDKAPQGFTGRADVWIIIPISVCGFYMLGSGNAILKECLIPPILEFPNLSPIPSAGRIILPGSH